jgi:hypothetical protein
VGKDFDKRADYDGQLWRPNEVLVGIVALTGLIAAMLNAIFAIYAATSLDWAAAWDFGICCVANIVIMSAPFWWRKVPSGKAFAILLVGILAGWIANCTLAWGYMATQWVL